MVRRWQPDLAAVIGVGIVAAALLAELQPLKDNSFLTHLATGRLILDRGSVPTADPYTFTAAGEPWVVQSWLVSVLYAGMERLGGLDAVRLLTGALTGVVAGLGWRLLRPADGLVVRLALGATFILVGAGQWAERPFMVGLIAFALTVLAAEGGLDPRWLVPIGWVWVNSHGSFPLGLVFLGVAALGTWLDGSNPSRELRCLRWAGLGVLLGGVSPLGPRLLVFPLELLRRQELLSNVLEWQAPSFDTISQRAFLVQLVAAIVLLARRPSYRGSLVTGVFVAAALLGSRNITVASIALLPGMALAASGIGSLPASARPRRVGALFVATLMLAALFVSARLQEPALRLTAYPVDALAYLEEANVDTRQHHLAAPELVGNLITFVYGAQGRVFYDDRFDMFPEDVSRAELALTDATPSVFDDLARYDVELITVRRTHPMALVLNHDPAWRILYTDEHWLLACERGADLEGSLGRC
jgi:hypothetical protein